MIRLIVKLKVVDKWLGNGKWVMTGYLWLIMAQLVDKWLISG